MVTALIYLFNGLILAVFSYKVFKSLRKKKNPFMLYFLGTTGFYSLSLFVYFLIITFSVYLGNNELLFWSDFFGRLFLYLGSVFAIQIPLYKYYPKQKFRYYFSGLIAVGGFALTVYNYFYRNYPTIDASMIVHWNAQSVLSIGLAILLIGVWIPTSIVFFNEFIKSNMKSTKAFFLSSGFFMSALGGMFQDFGRNTEEYIFINLLMSVGYIMIFIGLFKDE